MSDEMYDAWAEMGLVEGIPHETAKRGDVVILDVGAGTGKFLAKAKSLPYLNVSRVIGIEPSPLNVCNGNQFFPEVELHVGTAEKLECLGLNSAVDLVTTVGVFCYLGPLEYLCSLLEMMLRTLKPGGIMLHMWVLDNPSGKGDDKLNTHPQFWISQRKRKDGSRRYLPACSADIQNLVKDVDINLENYGGPEEGYAVRVVRSDVGHEKGVRNGIPDRVMQDTKANGPPCCAAATQNLITTNQQVIHGI